MSARGSVPPPPTAVPKGIGKHPWVLAYFVGSLANSSDSFTPEVEEAHAAHNMISGFHFPLLKDKLGHAKLKNDLVSLKSKKSLLEHEMSKLEDHLTKAQRNQDMECIHVVRDLQSKNAQILKEVLMLRSMVASAGESQKELLEELSGLRPCLEEVDRLKQRPSLEKAKFVKDFLPSMALDEVYGLRDSWDFKDVQDYHPESEKLFDEADEAFYKLKKPLLPDVVLFYVCEAL
nr:hypothetical protein [Tanacetum cinerariifolium]